MEGGRGEGGERTVGRSFKGREEGREGVENRTGCSVGYDSMCSNITDGCLSVLLYS